VRSTGPPLAAFLLRASWLELALFPGALLLGALSLALEPAIDLCRGREPPVADQHGFQLAPRDLAPNQAFRDAGCGGNLGYRVGKDRPVDRGGPRCRGIPLISLDSAGSRRSIRRHRGDPNQP
jgi:hypothetical protein